MDEFFESIISLIVRAAIREMTKWKRRIRASSVARYEIIYYATLSACHLIANYKFSNREAN